jgi:hypothetical protein
MNGELDFFDTCIISDAVYVARTGGSSDLCPFDDKSERKRSIWLDAFNAYLDGRATRNEQVRVAA